MFKKFSRCSENDQKWITDYLSSGKGVIPYETITTFDSLNISPQSDQFFPIYYFYSDLKDDIISSEDYEKVKKFWRLMNFEDLGKLHKIYNFQDTIILFKIFEQRSDQLQKLFRYNPRKCNLASSAGARKEIRANFT